MHQYDPVGVGIQRRGHERIPDDADAVRVGDRHWRRQLPGLAHPLEAGQLAVPVQPVAAGEDRLPAAFHAARQDDGHAGADRALADHQRAVARDEGRVPDASRRRRP
ncbi:MAG: hypothetical protein WKF78_09850 [Candidatus Limnocylindrales bacterium]